VAVFDVLNEPEFVRRAVSGDSDAFHQLFDLLAVPLAAFVERMGLSAPDAEEIAADALVKVQKSLPTYRVRGAKLTTWIFEIARNCAIDFRRAISKRTAQDEEFCMEYRRANGYESTSLIVRTAAEAEAVNSALNVLSVGDRDILRMREVMEYSEIALAEGATEQTVRVRHKRALDRLKLQLAQRRSHV
jgi:RNA polymerase sigma-70 factor, ECF subfamily